MTENKSLGEITFQSSPRAGRIIGIYFLGGVIVNIGLSIFMLIVGGALVQLTGGLEAFEIEEIDVFIAQGGPILVVMYFVGFLLYRALMQVSIGLAIAQHFAEETTVLHPENLVNVLQRDRDESDGAEGFADALDVGAAI